MGAKKFFIFELVLAAHVSFCLLIELQAVLYPRQLTLEELDKLPPKAVPHANHNKYFDLFSFIGFIFWLLLKYLFEGFRANSLIIFTAYALFFFDRAIQFSDKIFCQASVMLTVLYLWSLISYPVYSIPRPTGKFPVSYKHIRMNDAYRTEVSVFYPCADNKAEPVSIQWLPNKKFAKQLYELIIMAGYVPISEWCFDVAYHFLKFLKFEVCPEMPPRDKQQDVIILSHGFTQHRNAHAYFARQWASEGFVVFCPQHEEMIYPWDQKGTKIASKGNFPEVLEKYQNIRSKHLDWRVEQVAHIIEALEQGKISEVFYDFKPGAINLVGHSFGGATVLRVAQHYKVNSVIGLDPWLFPFKEEHFSRELKSRTLVLIQDRKIKDELHDFTLMERFLEIHQKVSNYRVKGFDHVYSTDLTFFLGGEMQLMGRLRNSERAHFMNHLLMDLTKRFILNTPFSEEQQKQLLKTK